MLIQKILTARTFSWADHTEYFLSCPEFDLQNRDTGLPSSSFLIEAGTYEVTISSEKLPEAILNGSTVLCGSEKDNLFLEDVEEDFKRQYSLSQNDYSLIVYEDYGEISVTLVKVG